MIAKEQQLQVNRDAASKALDSIWGQIQQLREDDTQVSAQLDALRSGLQDNRGRLASMEALQQAALGETDGNIMAWLEANQLAARPRLAQSLAVDKGWEMAVETVLGGYLEAVCVAGIDQVAGALGTLGDARVMLLEVDTDSTTPARQGLAALVDGPVAAKELLAGIQVADSLEEALRLRPNLAQGESVVTRDGIWLARHWLRVNRSDDPRSGVLARGEEINQLRAAVGRGSKQVAEVESRLASIRIHLDELEDARSEAQAKAGHQQQLYGDTKGELDACRGRLEQMQDRAAELDRAVHRPCG